MSFGPATYIREWRIDTTLHTTYTDTEYVIYAWIRRSITPPVVFSSARILL